MTWRYHQGSGYTEDAQGMGHGCGYAGKGKGKNNSAMQDIHGGMRMVDGRWETVEGLTGEDWGPLPCGLYQMNPPVDTTKHGPFVLWLTPDKANEMFGRSAFGWHGDSKDHPGLASEGCIASPHATRVEVWNGGDHQLEVVP